MRTRAFAISLGLRMQALRENSALSQTSVALTLKMSRGTYRKCEYGEATPNALDVTNLCQLYNVSLSELLEPARVGDIMRLVNNQVEDEALWFETDTAMEEFLQLQLTELHKIIKEKLA